MFVLMQNIPLLIIHMASYIFRRPVGPRAFKIFGYRFWIRNTNTIGMLQKSMFEIHGIRQKAYSEVDAFIDIGGHAGAKAFAAKYVNPGLQVFLFEPNPLNIELLRLTFKNVQNIEIIEAGVGKELMTQKLYFDLDHLDTASLNRNHYFLNKNSRSKIIEKEVQITSLDDFFSKRNGIKYGYLKIDVESTEAAVLDGGIETLKRCVYLELEISQGDTQNASDILLKLVKELKFNILDFELIGIDQDGLPRAINLLLKRRE